ncbi:MAG: hypothetical protein JNN11_00460 [Candidatus Doudnabacteria bacterium]|nr:hypothetical protein [Candidatus Doudnabacteria bacterium]
MIDPELQHYLSGINQHLGEIKKNQKVGVWRAFFNGVFGALGYAVGLAIVVGILGWILKETGYLGKFRQQARDFQSIINELKNLRQPFNETGESVITLPDGREVKVISPTE